MCRYFSTVLKAKHRLLLLFFVCCFVNANAQTYSPVAVTGFNEDVVAENTTALANTSNAMDLSNNVMYSVNFATNAGITGGILNSGTIVSGTRTYQMQPFTSNNGLHITQGTAQTLTLTTPMQFSKLSLMGISTESSCTVTITVNFTNGSSTNYTNITIQDWFNGTGNVYCCYGRTQRVTTGYTAGGVPTNPMFYPTDLTLSCADKRKLVQSLTINITSGTTANSRVYLFALSGVPYWINIVPTVTSSNCTSANGSIALAVTGTAAAYTYLWNTTPAQTTATATGLASGIYSCTISETGCVDSIYVDTVKPTGTPLVITATPAASAICVGDSVSISVSGATTYSWSPATGLLSTTGATVFAKPTVTTTYTIHETTSGCNGFTTATVTVNPLPTVSVLPASSVICRGDSVALKATGATTYSWNPPPFKIIGGDSAEATPISNTTYIITGTAAGCHANDTITITVNPIPIVIASPHRDTICHLQSVHLSVSGANTYNWSPGANLSTTVGNTVVATPTTNATYHVTGNSLGCVASDSVMIIVNPLPIITVLPDSPAICEGQHIVLNASGANSYSWLPNTSLSSATGSSVSAYPTATTTYIITGVSALHCTSTDTVVLTVNPLPTFDYLPSINPICPSDSAILNYLGVAPAGSSFVWKPAASLNNAALASPIAKPSVNTTYTVTITSPAGCIATGNVTLAVSLLPAFSIGPDTMVCIGNPIQLFANGGTHYHWQPNSGYDLSCTDCNTPIITPQSNETIALPVLIYNANNCIETDTVHIKTNDACLFLSLPNAFTPNNDGLDDIFQPIGDAKLIRFQIFDRWGTIVYDNNDATTGWDGSYQGKPQQIGVYMWVMIYKTPYQTITAKGDVTLLR